MDAGTWRIMSYIAFSIAGISLLTGIVLFVKFDVIALIGEVSGKTAEKTVMQIREQNRNVINRRMAVSYGTPRTATSNLAVKEVKPQAELLGEGKATTLLGDEEIATTLLGDEETATTLLTEEKNEAIYEEYQETTILTDVRDEANNSNGIRTIHTNEYIEI